jgi:hypothetical protein
MGLTRHAARVTFVGVLGAALTAMNARHDATGSDGRRAYPEIVGITGEGWS